VKRAGHQLFRPTNLQLVIPAIFNAGITYEILGYSSTCLVCFCF